jgi:hypothetical protein
MISSRASRISSSISVVATIGSAAVASTLTPM